MRAAVIHRHGGPEVLAVTDVEPPRPRGRQVLIAVAAAAVNPRDWLLREGRYQFGPLTGGFPLILGSDVSGTVVELGPRARRFAVGDAVFGMQTVRGGMMGGYAERVAIDERALARTPAAVSHVDAAAAPCAGLTALQALTDVGRVVAGHRVVVNGASGGVGHYAVQIAKLLGAEVTAVASARSLDFLRSLGADRVVDYGAERFTDTVRDQHLVFDAVGRTSLAACRPVLRTGGRYVTTVPRARTILAAIGTRLLRWLTLGRAPSAHLMLVRSRGRDLERIAAWLADGRLRSHVEEVFPLADVAAAHRRSASWHTRGKLVLAVAGDAA